MEFTEESNQGYCPWVDETSGCMKKSLDGARIQVSIPKRMKTVIDGDLASIRDDGKCSTKDRLREKLRQKQERVAQSIGENHGVKETHGKDSRKKIQGKKQSKKAIKSKVVSFTENVVQENNDVIKYVESDEMHEVVEESLEARQESKRLKESYDNRTNEKIDDKDIVKTADDITTNTEESLCNKLQSVVMKTECIKAKLLIKIRCNDSKIKEILNIDIPYIKIKSTGPMAENSPRSISTMQRNDSEVINKKDLSDILVGVDNLQLEHLKTDLLEKHQIAAFLAYILQNNSWNSQEICTMPTKKSKPRQENVSKKITLSHEIIQNETVIFSVYVDQDLIDGFDYKYTAKEFLIKLHSVIAGDNSLVESHVIPYKEQSLYVPPKSVTTIAITNLQKIDICETNISTSMSVSLLELSVKEKDDRQCPDGSEDNNIQNDLNVSTQQQDTSHVSGLKVIEQNHHGIRLCTFD